MAVGNARNLSLISTAWLYNNATKGGAFDLGMATDLVISDSYFGHNQASLSGGAVHVSSATRALIQKSVFEVCHIDAHRLTRPYRLACCGRLDAVHSTEEEGR